jgi:mRNA-degrading endonuclease RelE of RelBE toxin-antitoxin system
MIIVETPTFTRRVQALLPDEQYRLLQNELVGNPNLGRLIPGSGGLRKLRWSTAGRGKRGGVRIIYYWLTARDTILMLFIYPKGVQDDLTRKQLKALKGIVDKEYQ